MKQSCPSCRRVGISPLAKRWSAHECPAKSSLCGAYSHVLASTSSGIFVGSILVFVVAMIATIALNAGTWLAAFAAACFSALFDIWTWRRAEMFPIPKESAKAAATANWLLVAFYALCAMLS